MTDDDDIVRITLTATELRRTHGRVSKAWESAEGLRMMIPMIVASATEESRDGVQHVLVEHVNKIIVNMKMIGEQTWFHEIGEMIEFGELGTHDK